MRIWAGVIEGERAHEDRCGYSGSLTDMPTAISTYDGKVQCGRLNLLLEL